MNEIKLWKQKMFLNIIKSYRNIFAICDSELLGKKFEEGKFQLDVKESFYKGKQGKKFSEKEILELMETFNREDATFNIVGEKSISAALKSGIISGKEIGRIQGIPFALVLL
mgnify:CR=1 FL=1